MNPGQLDPRAIAQKIAEVEQEINALQSLQEVTNDVGSAYSRFYSCSPGSKAHEDARSELGSLLMRKEHLEAELIGFRVTKLQRDLVMIQSLQRKETSSLFTS
jgi:hypothetical protein